MAKRKSIKKSNKLFTYNSHHYVWGGDSNGASEEINPFDLKGTFSGNNISKMLQGNLGNTIGTLGGNLISGGLNSKAGNTIGTIGSTIGGAIGTVNPILGSIVSTGSGLLKGVTNALFGSNLNQENINTINESNKGMNTFMVDNNNIDSIMNQWSNQNFGNSISKSDIGKDGLFSNKATNIYNELLNQQNIARNKVLTSYTNAINTADNQSNLNMLANYAAYGGPINIFDSRVIDHEFAKGGKIHIKKANRGKFTDYCGGKVTSECIARGKRSKNAAVRKRAIFAANARKWHHALGGYLYDEGGNLYVSVPNIGQHGGNFSNGVTIIGNGGTHEENPMEGVPMGIAPDGIPNLVEQGEVKFNDYIFSNRLFADDKLLETVNLPKSYNGHSFADIAISLSKESSERPNDPISKRGLISAMTRLQQAQEQLKAKKQNRKYAKGGHLFVGGGPAGINPDLYDEEDGYLVVPTGSKITGNPFAYDDAGYQTPVTISSKSTLPNTSSRQGKGLTWLRYAPVVGAAIGVGQNLFSKPDYTGVDTILEASDQIGNYTPVDYTPIGNYLTYKPFDRNFYTNKLNAQSGATRGAIMNTSSPSRNATLLAADHNAQNALGNLARQAEEYNLAQRQSVEQFNRATNQANAEMDLRSALANQEAELKAKSARLNGIAQAMSMKDNIDARRGASISANMTNFFNSLGDIGRERYSRNMIMSNPALYYSIDNNGNVSYKNGYENLSEAEKEEVRNAANKAKKKAKGGYLTIRRK